MPYVTLREAAEIVERETGIDITVLQLLRAGAVQNLPLCVLLDTQCYSPTHRVRREKLAFESDPDYWKKTRPGTDENLDVVNAYGLFVLPPRHVFAYQMNESVRVESVTSLDGQDIYFPGVTRARDDLQITLPDLTKFIDGIKAAKPVTEPQPAPAQKADTESSPVVEVPASETPEQRRARWLDWYGQGERGAVQRVYERELLQNPKADRSYIGKQITIAEAEQTTKKLGDQWASQLVQDGKRKG